MIGSSSKKILVKVKLIKIAEFDRLLKLYWSYFTYIGPKPRLPWLKLIIYLLH